MKKQEPDPRQIAFDLGLPEEPAPAPPPETKSGSRPGAKSKPKPGLNPEPMTGRRGRRRNAGASASRVSSDWDSLQENAPEETAAIPGTVPAGAFRVQAANGPASAAGEETEPPFEPPAGLPADPDAWSEPVDLCPIIPEPPDVPLIDVALPDGPADLVLPTRIAWAGRRPYSLVAGPLQPGDLVRLQRERGNPHDPHAIRILNRDGDTAGYVYAEAAAWLSLLIDLSPPERDESVVIGNDGRHVSIDIRLHMAEAWAVFTIVAIFGLRSEGFSRQFNLQGNPYLRPLALLNQRFLANYDYFRMPPAIVDAYAILRQRFDALQEPEKTSLQDSIDNTSDR